MQGSVNKALCQILMLFENLSVFLPLRQHKVGFRSTSGQMQNYLDKVKRPTHQRAEAMFSPWQLLCQKDCEFLQRALRTLHPSGIKVNRNSKPKSKKKLQSCFFHIYLLLRYVLFFFNPFQFLSGLDLCVVPSFVFWFSP